MQRENALMELLRYREVFPDEGAKLTALLDQLETDPNDVFDRKNMLGHITTTGFVVDVKRRKVLLIWHNLYKRWLSPGGHYELLMALYESALREIVEETSVETAKLHEWYGKMGGCPWDIDTHAIEEQPQKNEGAHVHHDFIYLFEADSTKPIIPQLAEVSEAIWADLDFLDSLDDPRLVRMKNKLTQFNILN